MIDRLKAWVYLLCFQATWSYRSMQTAGWLMIAMPFVRKRFPEDPGPILARVAKHFNTHPMMAPLLIGAALEVTKDKDLDPDTFEQVVAERLGRWMGTLGAIGDVVYWQGLCWNLSWLGVVLWLGVGWQGVLGLSLLWLAAEIGLRIVLFEVAYHRPEAIVSVLQRIASPKFRETLIHYGAIGILFAGGVLFGQSAKQFAHLNVMELLGVLGCIAAVIVATKTKLMSAVVWLPGLLVSLGYLMNIR